MGYSVSGKSVAKYLHNNGGIIHIYDDNPAKLNEITADGFKIYPNNDQNLHDMDYLVVSPGIGNNNPLIARALQVDKPMVLDIDLLLMARAHNTKFIAITGTNGKSTTTNLMNHVLQFAGLRSVMGGNIGIPAMDLINQPADYIILELSSYQLERMQPFAFDVAILLNLSYDHLERHGTMAEYARVKEKIFSPKLHNKVNIIGVDDEFCQELYIKNPHLTPISGIKNIFQGAGWREGYLFHGWQEIMRITEKCPIQGYHNQQNIAAVWLGFRHIMGDKPFNEIQDIFVRAVNSYQPLAHRQQFIAEVNGVKFINDSKATNVASAYLSLQNFNNIHWLAGGLLKEGDDFPALAQPRERIKRAYFYGTGAPYLAKILGNAMQYGQYDTMHSALNDCIKNAVAGDVVLLAPAGASFDQFKNFEDRGNQFVEFVRAIPN